MRATILAEQTSRSDGGSPVCEIELDLFVPSRMLLSPKFQQKGRHGGQHGLRSMHFGMAAGAEGQHQPEHRSTWNPVMHDDTSFVPA